DDWHGRHAWDVQLGIAFDGEGGQSRDQLPPLGNVLRALLGIVGFVHDDGIDGCSRRQGPNASRRGIARGGLEVSPPLWAVLACAGVEPTNNHAVRLLPRAVLWRRRSFGCLSAACCRFVERMLTAVQSLRLQKRAVLAFLHETLCAHRTGTQTPRLVDEG